LKVQGEYVFDGPREEVWELLRDPEVLATALPGTQSLTPVSENEYEGKMHVRVGPVVGVFSGRIIASNEAPPESYTLTVEGNGRMKPLIWGMSESTPRSRSEAITLYISAIMIAGMQI